jgi:mannose-6-phosphate isomerase-like protein (cupin superfamily)
MAFEKQCDEYRPWGYYQVLEESVSHKVKRIVVNPGKRLSLQRHRHRAEHWYAVEGRGLATIDGKETILERGNAINIPQGALHRVAALSPEPFVIIEIQTGDYFGEDDIERIEDDFGRT